MALAYFVYTLLLVFLLAAGRLCSKLKETDRNIILFLSITVCSIVIGMRYDVGEDFLSYESIYKYQNRDDIEFGYAIFNQFLYSLGLPSSILFTIVAFLQLFIFAKGVININPRYLPFAFFFYFTTLYFFFSINGLRQAIAFSCFVYSIKFVVEKKLIKYIITLLFASSIHKSALTLIPLYFVINNDWLLKHRLIQLIGYFLTFVFSITLSDYVWANFETIASISGYSDYADSGEILKDIKWSKENGLGKYLWLLIDIWVMFYFYKIRGPFITKYDISIYNLYYIGLLLTNVFAGSYLDRANLYFQNYRILVYTILFSCIFKMKYKFMHKIIAVAVILALIIFFYMAIYNKAGKCAPYQFV